MTTYSHSRIATFEQCRYKYKLKYVDHEEGDSQNTIEAFMGDIVHKTLYKLYRDLQFQKLNSLRELLVYYNDIWKKGYTKDIMIVKKDYTANNYRKMGADYIIKYYEQYKPFNDMTIIDLETQERMNLPDGNSYHIRIDKLGCVGSTYYVCDYKTNMSMKDQEEVDSDRQLAMYSIWVKDHFKDAKKIILKWHMVTFNKELVSERTSEQLEILKKEVMQTIKDITNCKAYHSNVTKLCNYCEYRSKCPSMKHEVVLEKKKDIKKDDGLMLVDKYAKVSSYINKLEEEKEELKESIISFSKKYGIDVVYGSNKKISVKEIDKIVLPEDKEKLILLLKKKGVYDEFVTLNYMKFTSAVNKGVLDPGELVQKEKDFRISISSRKIED